jgi:hypothetical protein
MSDDCAVLLYGSHARGDADAISDVDVIVVAPRQSEAVDISPLLPQSCKGILHVSNYTWTEMEAMSLYGSLFLHHIATEAKGLRYEGNGRERLAELLRDLCRYRHPERDLIAFRTTISDAKKGLDLGLPPSFELAVVGGVARHASVLACYLAGTPTFGRGSISAALRLFGMSRDQTTLELAHRFRLFEEGQCGAPCKPLRATADRACDAMFAFLDRLEALSHDYNS